MDFVQRNLINERNNLQIELAKAKLLIAELSEEINSAGKQEAVVADRAYAQNRKPTGAEQAALIRHAQNDSKANARVKIANQSRPKPMSEEAEYISDLENVIIAIAEQLGVHPNDLLNELNVGGAIKSGYQAGGVMGAIKGAVRGIGVNMRQAGNSILPANRNQRLAGVARKAGEGAQIAARSIERTVTGQQKASAKVALGMGPDNSQQRRIASVERNSRIMDRAVDTGDRVTNVAKTFAGQNSAMHGFDKGRYTTRTMTDRWGHESHYNH